MSNYETIVLELMQRVQELEKRVHTLESICNEKGGIANSYDVKGIPEECSVSLVQKKKTKMQSIREYLKKLITENKMNGNSEIVLRAGDIEKAVGLQNRTVMVVNAMYELQKEYRSEIVSTTSSGYSTTVIIKYYLD